MMNLNYRRLIRNMRKAKEERRALLLCASHCQGGHSVAGEAAALVLGIDFPITQENLVKAAERDGFDPVKLWPWSVTAKRRAAKVKRTATLYEGERITLAEENALRMGASYPKRDRSDPEGGIPGRAL